MYEQPEQVMPAYIRQATAAYEGATETSTNGTHAEPWRSLTTVPHYVHN